MVRPLAPNVTFTHQSCTRSESAKVHKVSVFTSQRLHPSDSQRKTARTSIPSRRGCPIPFCPRLSIPRSSTLTK